MDWRGACRLLAVLALTACAGPRVLTPLPPDIRKIALHPMFNRTGQAGLEDALLTRTRDEILRDGRVNLVPEKDADAVLWVTITRYLNVPVQYDVNLAPTAYKLSVSAQMELRAKKDPEHPLRSDKSLVGIQIYSAATLAGGIGEIQAQSQVWDVMARDIVSDVVVGPR